MSAACVGSLTRVSIATLLNLTRTMSTLTLFRRCSRLISVNVSRRVIRLILHH